MHGRRALVRRPSPRLAEGLLTHLERSPVDADRAIAQWDGYVQAFVDAGWQVIEVEPAPDSPDSGFVEDTMVVYGDLAVIARSGAVERRDETAAAEKAVADAGYRIAHIEAPGVLDGGDVLKHGGTVYVGQSARSNAHAIGQLAEYLAPFGAQVVAVPLTKVLHLKSAVTALPDGTVIGYSPVVDDPAVFGDFLPVPEEPGAHVVLLGDGKLLMSSNASKTASLMRERGYEPVLVDIGEFEKLEGCVTCLSVRLRGV
ncbi:N-dimethylarginine dimethylaminohydrolase [Mycolicibacterium rhodesiae NBB3]|uniref:N-dimethylarginine dimethylaminohydrolase n=1 Tax=Mycolicibacterium rhodesiae (strain NBB3) TaxID=710685 RepID=G8RVE0_MYCRN|nr:dimethylargininase [Mycolicibacterium rhodesiae]AEV73012.1 N-dimethylarginine dimethylaminohydrolase [Mycolicibacterium rhodesiae NBB3]